MRFLKYFFLLLAAFIWLSVLNTDIFKQLGKLNLFTDGYQFGDLYRLSNLPQFKDPKKDCAKYSPFFLAKPGRKKINLFIIGDSFTEPGRVSKADFNVDSYQYVHWGEALHFRPDTSAYNILLIECVERHIREKFASPLNNIKADSATFVSHGELSFMQKLDQAFASDSKEERLDMMLFQNGLILALKEWKATLNYKFFGRVREEVTLVNNDRDIVFYMDTDTAQTSKDHEVSKSARKTTSSFTPLPKSEVDTIVSNVAKSKLMAEQMGFDHVILSIIPNKISVISPEWGVYNNLIDRVYADTSLKLPVIDVFPQFKAMGTSSYLKGDSHWTCEGQNIWLDNVNTLLERLIGRSH
jgi:hypothetical protein